MCREDQGLARRLAKRPRDGWAERAAVALALSAAFALGGCKVVTIQADQAARERLSGAFDADRYVDAVWDSQALPHWSKNEVPIARIAVGAASDLGALGRTAGRQAGYDSPWIFVAAGEGRVVETDTASPAGRVVVDVPVDGRAERVTLQVGPFVSGAALRDSLPFVNFNDFANQLAYADVARAVTARATTSTRPVAIGLKAGDQVRFAGGLALSSADDPLVVTPYRLERVGPATGGS